MSETENINSSIPESKEKNNKPNILVISEILKYLTESHQQKYLSQVTKMLSGIDL